MPSPHWFLERFVSVMKPDDNMVVKEQEAYTAFRARLEALVRNADSPDKLLALENILYDIIEEEIQINDMLNEYMDREKIRP